MADPSCVHMRWLLGMAEAEGLIVFVEGAGVPLMMHCQQCRRTMNVDAYCLSCYGERWPG